MKHDPELLMERDRRVIWHPFTQHGLAPNFLPVTSAKGAWLELSDGTRIIDAIASWWVNIHGHAHPKIAQAIFAQAQRLEHVIFSNCTHEPAVKLAEILLEATCAGGASLTRCFYSDNGSTAVEVALKMAYQFHKNQGIKTRTRFLALSNGYHGDTLGCMSVSERDGFHRHFTELFAPTDFVVAEDIAAFKKLLAENADQYAAMIVEPMIQGSGGMRFHSAEVLRELATLCHEAKILLICDEAFTGFYRTGKCFAFEHAGIKPDLLCLAKGITGGFLPLAVTLATEKIFEAFYSQEMAQTFFHGHSYTANPLACAAALASWELLQQTETQSAIRAITARTQQWVERLAQHPHAENARALGTIGAVNIRNFPGYFSGFGRKITEMAIQSGVLLRPLGSVLYALPPYCVTEPELDQIYETMQEILNELDNLL